MLLYTLAGGMHGHVIVLLGCCWHLYSFRGAERVMNVLVWWQRSTLEALWVTCVTAPGQGCCRWRARSCCTAAPAARRSPGRDQPGSHC